MTDELAQAHQRCMTQYDALVALSLDEERLPETIREVLLKVQNERNRYAIWATNAGAGHSGVDYKRSLDYRLRLVETYRVQILRILARIEELVVKICGLAKPASVSRASSEVHELLDRNRPITLYQTPSDDSAHSSDSDDDPTLQAWGPASSDIFHDRNLPRGHTSPGPTDLITPFLTRQSTSETVTNVLETAYASLRLAVTYLYKIPLRLPVPMARLKDLPNENDDLMKFYEVIDHKHVLEVFPLADSQLALRLASAITQRRRLLKYRETRSLKLQATSGAAIREEGMSVTATTLRPATNFPSDLPPVEVEPSEAGTLSTTATSVQSEKLHLPKRPRTEAGDPLETFECPCCYRAVHVSARDRAWKKHIFSDLEAYQCTVIDCPTGNATFPSKEEWTVHQKQHLFVFKCGTDEHGTFTEEKTFLQHLFKLHGISLPSPCPTESLSFFRRALPGVNSAHCPLCRQQSRSILPHMAAHLERIALFALPSHITGDTDESDSENDTGSRQSMVVAESPSVLPHTASNKAGGSIGGAIPSLLEESGKQSTGRTDASWTADEELRLKEMRDTGNSWSEIAKVFPSRTEFSVAEHWYKNNPHAEFTEDESVTIQEAIREQQANKWKETGSKLGKPARHSQHLGASERGSSSMQTWLTLGTHVNESKLRTWLQCFSGAKYDINTATNVCTVVSLRTWTNEERDWITSEDLATSLYVNDIGRYINFRGVISENEDPTTNAVAKANTNWTIKSMGTDTDGKENDGGDETTEPTHIAATSEERSTEEGELQTVHYSLKGHGDPMPDSWFNAPATQEETLTRTLSNERLVLLGDGDRKRPPLSISDPPQHLQASADDHRSPGQRQLTPPWSNGSGETGRPSRQDYDDDAAPRRDFRAQESRERGDESNQSEESEPVHVRVKMYSDGRHVTLKQGGPGRKEKEVVEAERRAAEEARRKAELMAKWEVVTEPGSPPGHAKSSMDAIQALASTFYNLWLPSAEAFLASPPVDPAAREKEFLRINESIMDKIVFPMDFIDALGNVDVRNERRALFKEANNVLMRLGAMRYGDASGASDNTPQETTEAAEPSSTASRQGSDTGRSAEGYNLGTGEGTAKDIGKLAGTNDARATEADKVRELKQYRMRERLDVDLSEVEEQWLRENPELLSESPIRAPSVEMGGDGGQGRNDMEGHETGGGSRGNNFELGVAPELGRALRTSMEDEQKRVAHVWEGKALIATNKTEDSERLDVPDNSKERSTSTEKDQQHAPTVPSMDDAGIPQQATDAGQELSKAAQQEAGEGTSAEVYQSEPRGYSYGRCGGRLVAKGRAKGGHEPVRYCSRCNDGPYSSWQETCSR